MKSFTILFVWVATGLILASAAFASSPASSKFTAAKVETIEDNLLLCLASEYPGVRSSAALTLKQLKAVASDYSFNRSVIPLMKIVNGEQYDSQSRIAAALALYSLESERGDYAIRMTAKLTETERVKFIYEHLAYARTQEKLASR
jgi:HEAT repeat protein